jgi:SPX domain protein involved in polyphosphate accumulation
MEQYPLQSSVTYWIHNDNLVETELFLLKHMTLRVPSSSPVTSGSVQLLRRTAYFDTDAWDIYQSMVPENANSSVRVNPPHLAWEENSLKKEVLIVVPSEKKPLPIKRKDVSKFLASNGDISSPVQEWPSSQQHIHDYFRSLHPSMILSFINLLT